MITQLHWDFECPAVTNERCMVGHFIKGGKCFECQSRYGDDIANVFPTFRALVHIHMMQGMEFERVHVKEALKYEF
jgi:hypothetical protein